MIAQKRNISGNSVEGHVKSRRRQQKQGPEGRKHTVPKLSRGTIDHVVFSEQYVSGGGTDYVVSLERNVANVREKNSTIRIFVVIGFNSSFGEGNNLHGDRLHPAERTSCGQQSGDW